MNLDRKNRYLHLENTQLSWFTKQAELGTNAPHSPSNIQGSLFPEISRLLSISEAAAILGISQATVRNWIKTGVLTAFGDNKRIELAQVEELKLRVCGISRLVSRANKTQKRISKIPTYREGDSQGLDLGTIYEETLSEAYRNKEGIYYTPETIVSDMLQTVINPSSKTLLEPCCGSGNFVMEAIKRGFAPENIYAFDTDEQAVEITKQRVFEATGYKSENIVCVDFLQYALTAKERFDCIFTNPPWGKKIERERKKQLAEIFGIGNSTDTCSLFFAASLGLLRQGGELGFLLPESFFNIGVFEAVRQIVLSRKIERLVDYGKPFKTLLTKAHAVIIRNTEVLDNDIACLYNGNTFLRSQSSFRSMPKQILNFWATQDEADIITHIYNQPHYTLSKDVRWALGIVTGDNQRHCTTRPDDNHVPIFRGKDISPEHLKESGLYIDRSLRQCQQVAPLEMYNAEEKLIYRFISDKLIFYLDKHQSYILNSANLLTLNKEFPLTHRQVRDLLNSRLLNWLFHMVFNTRKVLRGDLELLPLLCAAFETNEHFNEAKLLQYLNIESLDGTYRFKK